MVLEVLSGEDVAFDDGVFEVTLIKTPKNPIELNEIVAALPGNKQINSDHMYSFRSGHVKFESEEEIPWTLDGEYGGRHDEVIVENLKQELEIMVKPTSIGHLERKEELVRQEEESEEQS